MNKEFIGYIIYVIVIWYIFKWILMFIAYGNNNKSDKEKDQDFKTYNNFRNIVFGVTIIILLINLLGLND